MTGMMPTGRIHRLFAYGTLRRTDIQRAHFGRLLDGEDDMLAGYRLAPEKIRDAEAAEALGIPHYENLVFTGDSGDTVAGRLFNVTDSDLAAADAYEAPEYARFQVRLRSGRRAWVYAATPNAKNRKT